ncbi:MFS general substrate transporter [Zopfia rhizophila CBS 207.26]|uniref:MFS general substrate transporter n=1 Tax=Zopfia rhizophila CBS 207.26 TaxID=1314779 RepID=A0A6A6D9R8_9PEZI|nr:MFS general substrate transporter [Zopfia rhizophila CBS 207.26]
MELIFADVSIAPCLNKDGFIDFKPGGVENPRNWSAARRWYITLCTVLLVLNGNFASSIPSGCLGSMTKEFHVSKEAASLTITLFLLGYCAGPFVFAPLSEFYGRRWVFYITFLLYMTFNFLCAFPPNFGGLLIGRFLAGICVSATLSHAPGVLADLWDPTERGNAMAIFSVGIWIGPSLGPIVAGFLELSKGWRWGFYVVLWLGAPSTLLMFTLPETHGPTILVQKAKRIREAKIRGYESVQAPAEANNPSLLGIYKIALTRPWILLFDPICFLCDVYIIYPIVFQQMRGWNAGVGQLPLIGTILGSFPGAFIIFLDTRRRKNKTDQGLELEPEDRFPVTMFWFAWTGQYNSVHWIVPTLAGTFLSTSLMLIFVAYVNYLVDVYLQFAASAVAGNTFARSVGSSAAPLFTIYMFKTLGVGGGGSLIAGVATLLAIIPFAFYKYGKQIRSKSKYAPADKEASAEKDEETIPTDYFISGGESRE